MDVNEMKINLGKILEVVILFVFWYGLERLVLV